MSLHVLYLCAGCLLKVASKNRKYNRGYFLEWMMATLLKPKSWVNSERYPLKAVIHGCRKELTQTL
jgi:hypothetical protein